MRDVIPKGFFVDAVNPTHDEIIRWAYIDGAHYPPEMSEDWDLCIAEPDNRELLLRLACDAVCPNRKFFLSCLYLLLGDVVRSAGQTWSFEEASAWLRRSRVSSPEDVVAFFDRAVRLLAGEEPFNYDNWCDGGFAYGRTTG